MPNGFAARYIHEVFTKLTNRAYADKGPTSSMHLLDEQGYLPFIILNLSGWMLGPLPAGGALPFWGGA